MKHETNFDKLYVTNEEFMVQLNKEEKLQFRLDEETFGDKCYTCNNDVCLECAEIRE